MTVEFIKGAVHKGILYEVGDKVEVTKERAEIMAKQGIIKTKKVTNNE